MITIMLSESNQQERWKRRYQEGRAAWDRGGPSPALDLGLAQIPQPPARELIPACDRGCEITVLSRRGYPVIRRRRIDGAWYPANTSIDLTHSAAICYAQPDHGLP